MQRKWGSESFWGKCLKMFVLLKSIAFQNVMLGATVDGRITVVCLYYRHPPMGV